LGYCAAVRAGRLNAPGARTGGTGDRLGASDTAQRAHRTGAGSGAAQTTVIRMAEAPAGRLDVGLGPLEMGRAVVVHQGVQAGQAGAGGQEDRQQEEGLGPEEARSPSRNGAIHRLEYTQARSIAVLRLTGPSAGRRNQKAAPLPKTESAPIVPPCISTNFLQRASPSPVP